MMWLLPTSFSYVELRNTQDHELESELNYEWFYTSAEQWEQKRIELAFQIRGSLCMAVNYRRNRSSLLGGHLYFHSKISWSKQCIGCPQIGFATTKQLPFKRQFPLESKGKYNNLWQFWNSSPCWFCSHSPPLSCQHCSSFLFIVSFLTISTNHGREPTITSQLQL